MLNLWPALRERILASRKFQRWAAGFWLTRPIARRHTRELFDLCAGFVYSQVLLACVRLDLFARLAGRPHSAAELTAALDLAPEVTERLLRAAAALRLLERRSGGRFGLGVLGAALRANPGIAAMVEHHALLYRDLADPVDMLRGRGRGAELAAYWPYAGGRSTAPEPTQVAPYSALMSASQPLISAEILAAYSFRRHRRVLDVGGGDGGFVCALAARYPQLRLVLFDLPAVATLAEQRCRREGLRGRVDIRRGDMFDGPLPQGADLITLVRVIHDHDDERAMELLRAVRRALPENGTLLLAEPMAQTAGAEPAGDAYFGFYLLAMGSGRPRPAGQLSAMLRAAGFRQTRLLPNPTPLLTRVMLARS